MRERRILQLNVRLSEGGAARVARTLSETLPSLGFDVRDAYGYGPHGRRSLAEEPGTVRVTSYPWMVANLAYHQVLGREFGPPSRSSGLKRLVAALEWADIVHVHAIHSYMVNTDLLFRQLLEAGKPVVWTQHDHWIVTGRCASPGDCDRWKVGCAPCANLSAYPPARLDTASAGWISRRNSVQALSSTGRLRLVACSQGLARDVSEGLGLTVDVVPNSVDVPFWDALAVPGPPRGRGSVSFVAADLGDKRKVDVSLLNKCAATLGKSLTIVGDKPPPELQPGNASVRNAIRDRRELASLLRATDTLLYSSRIDNHPLVVVEALAAGAAVIAPDAPWAEEFRHQPAFSTYSSNGQAVELVNTVRPSAMDAARAPAAEYSPWRMAKEYAAIYRGLGHEA